MFAWIVYRFAIVCVFLLLLLLLNFLPVVSGILEPAISRILDLVITWKVTFFIRQPPHAIRKWIWPFKKTIQASSQVSLGKKLFVNLCSAVQQLNKILFFNVINNIKWEHFFLTAGDRANNQSKNSLVATHTCASIYLQNIKHPFLLMCVSKNLRKPKKSLPILVGWHFLQLLTLI